MTSYLFCVMRYLHGILRRRVECLHICFSNNKMIATTPAAIFANSLHNLLHIGKFSSSDASSIVIYIFRVHILLKLADDMLL